MKKRILTAAAAVLFLAALLFALFCLAVKTDFDRVRHFDEPVFARKTEDNVGIEIPAVYRGPGYKILVYGNLRTKEQEPFVYRYRLCIGREVIEAAVIEN